MVDKMKEIKLSSEKIAIVDDVDYERLSGFHWYFDGRYAAKSLWNRETKKETKIYMHKLIVTVERNQFVDHINGNKLDNRRENLRVVSKQQNNMNQSTQTRTKHSKYKGVSWDKSRNKWVAYCKKDGKMNYLGRFNNEEEAALAYNQKALELFGEFAKLNSIV